MTSMREGSSDPKKGTARRGARVRRAGGTNDRVLSAQDPGSRRGRGKESEAEWKRRKRDREEAYGRFDARKRAAAAGGLSRGAEGQLARIVPSKRRTQHTAPEFCDQCEEFRQNVWRYDASNRGAVYICGQCVPVVMDRSFGGIDALDRAVSGGHFEGNRRRH